MDALSQQGEDWCLQLGEVPQQLKHPPLGGGRQPGNNTFRACGCSVCCVWRVYGVCMWCGCGVCCAWCVLCVACVWRVYGVCVVWVWCVLCVACVVCVSGVCGMCVCVWQFRYVPKS